MDLKQIEQKKNAVNRLIRCVSEYWDAFHKPIPMRVLSAKFARAMLECGGFNDVMDELKGHGVLEIVLSESGSKEVYPEGCCLKVEPRSKLL